MISLVGRAVLSLCLAIFLVGQATAGQNTLLPTPRRVAEALLHFDTEKECYDFKTFLRIFEPRPLSRRERLSGKKATVPPVVMSAECSYARAFSDEQEAWVKISFYSKATVLRSNSICMATQSECEGAVKNVQKIGVPGLSISSTCQYSASLERNEESRCFGLPYVMDTIVVEMQQ